MCSRVKEGCLESFEREGVLLEAAFIRKEQGVHFLIYFMRAQDAEHAMQVFEKSQLSIDLFHKQCGKELIQDHQRLTPIFYLESN